MTKTKAGVATPGVEEPASSAQSAAAASYAAQQDRHAAEKEHTAAKRAAAEARGLVEQMERAIEAGDPGVTAEQLAAQEHLARFAELRVEAKKRDIERARRAEVIAQADELVAIVRDRAAADTSLVGLLSGALDSIRAFRAAVDAHNGVAREWQNRAAHLDNLLAGVGEPARFGRDPQGRTIIDRKPIDVINASSFVGAALKLLNAEGIAVTEYTQGGVDPHVFDKLAALDLLRGQ